MSIFDQIFSTRASPASTTAEVRSNPLENPSVSLTDARGWNALFGSNETFAGEPVTVDSVLGIPAAWAAIDTIATAIASLPIHVFKRTGTTQERVGSGDPLQSILNDQVNDDFLTSSEFRRWLIVQYLTRGRALAWIERNKAGRVTNLWPLDLDTIEIKMVGSRRRYIERDGLRRSWEAHEVIDLIWLPGSKPGSHVDPVQAHRNTFALAIAADRYAAKSFKNGGVAPLKLKAAPGMSPEALQRATTAISAAISNGGMVLPLPNDMDLSPIGFDPSAMQLLELKRHLAIEISRIFRIPPTLIQSLENGTYSNTEQMSLQFVKGCIQPIVEQIEEEFLAKLFGRANRTNYVKFNLDGLTRGDLKTRWDAFRVAIHGGFRTPDEIRALDDLPPAPGGDRLLIQGATIPLEQAGTFPSQTTPTDDGQKDDQ